MRAYTPLRGGYLGGWAQPPHRLSPKSTHDEIRPQRRYGALVDAAAPETEAAPILAIADKGGTADNDETGGRFLDRYQ